MSRRKNLRLHNIDTEDDPKLLVRTANRESLAPSTTTAGKEFDAICLVSFAIKDDAVNVPPIGHREMHASAGVSSKDAMKLLNASRYRIACHAMPITFDDEGNPVPDHSSQFLGISPSEARSKEDFLLLSVKFPIYVGGFAEEGLASVGPLPGTHLRVRDNSVHGGTYGTLIETLDSKYNLISSQFSATTAADTTSTAGTPSEEAGWSGAGPVDTSVDGTPGYESADIKDLEEAFMMDLLLLLDELEAEGYLFNVVRTYRDAERQAHYKATGASTVNKSFHNNVDWLTGEPASLAADVNPIGMHSGTGAMAAEAYKALMELAPNYNLETGGEWSPKSSPWGAHGIGWDPMHVQRPQPPARLAEVMLSTDFPTPAGPEERGE